MARQLLFEPVCLGVPQFGRAVAAAGQDCLAIRGEGHEGDFGWMCRPAGDDQSAFVVPENDFAGVGAKGDGPAIGRPAQREVFLRPPQDARPTPGHRPDDRLALRADGGQQGAVGRERRLLAADRRRGKQDGWFSCEKVPDLRALVGGR